MRRRLTAMISVATLCGCLSTQPAAPGHPLWAQANAYAEDEMWGEAKATYLKILAEGPPPPELWTRLGQVHVALGHYEQALRFLTDPANSRADHFDTLFHRAEAYRGLGRFSDAIFHYQLALRQHPDDHETLKALAWSYYRSQTYTKGLSTSAHLLKKFPESLGGRIIHARLLLRMGKLKTARRFILSSMKRGPSSAEPYFRTLLGDSLLIEHQVDQAAESYRTALRAEPLLAGALLGLGRCHLLRKQPRQAARLLVKALRVKPDLIEGHLDLARAFERFDTKRALHHYRAFAQAARKQSEFFNLLPKIQHKITRLASR